MAEHVHTHESSSGIGFFLGAVLLIIFFMLLLYYGLPIIRQSTSAPQINVPRQVDVNVNNQ